MNNQRGGILSSLVLIPLVAIGAFLLGYYVGKYQGSQTVAQEKAPAMPDFVSQYLPKNEGKKEEYTFFKTLADKGDRTVSIDLKPARQDESGSEQRKAGPSDKDGNKAGAEHAADAKGARSPVAAPEPKQTTVKKGPVSAAPADGKLRYTIQIGSYADKKAADDEVSDMKKRGYASFLVASDLADKGIWYRVRVGSFSSKPAAEKLASELRSKAGLKPTIMIE